MHCETTISYSVAIRTLGTAGRKYEKLMDSVASLIPQPKEVIVVLPEGYKKPDYQIGFEKFVYSCKGMIVQRLAALDYITTDYILFCDDDVEFNSDFIQILYEPLQNGYSCSTGPLLDFFPPEGLKYFFASILGGACVMLRGKDKMYTRILNTGGWSYNRSIKTNEHCCYDAESLAWTCFFIKTKVMRDIHFEDETWIERNGYAAFDDRIMFYKMLKMGYKSCVVSDATYIHNDAMTSSRNLKLEPIYARAFNHYVFWHRCLYLLCKNPLKRMWMKVCIHYYIGINTIYDILLKKVGRKTPEQVFSSQRGFKDAIQFVKSEEYRTLAKWR